MNKTPWHPLIRNDEREAPAEPIDHTRRHLVRGALAAGALAGLPLAGCSGGGEGEAAAGAVVFSHGVASGDPLSDRVILWTRALAQDAADLRDVPLSWEVASDPGFTALVASGGATARAAADFCVKVDAIGLKPGTRYWYRFKAGGATSVAGRTKTLPAGDVSRVKLAVFSCSNYPAGYFNVYAEAAKRVDAEGYDAALHLGDYIYEYGPDGYASSEAQSLGRVVEPARETVALEDYRRRYAQYRSDADLQALHAALPMIAVWDDHEFANDAWKDGAQNHQPAAEGEFAARKAAAAQAWREWLPVRDGADPLTIHRGFDFGTLLSLHMLDTRMAGRDRQLDYSDYLSASGQVDRARFETDLARPDRSLLGAAQQQWLQGRMQASAATWQVLGQQVLMGRMLIPAPILLNVRVPGSGVTVSQFAAIAAKAQRDPNSLTPQEQAVLGAPRIPYNLDAWDGYPVAREQVFGMTRQLDRNLVVLAGDTHNAWANNLRDASDMPVGVEFAVASVSSPGIERVLTGEDPRQLAASLTQLIEPLAFADTSRRGYMVVTVTPAECRCDWVFVSTVLSREYEVVPGPSWRTLPGAGQRRLMPA